ncbi:MAG: VWA domain-containing protein [Meiothermus sp.]|uniref:VWA domain-containing protein n=1 Tax=Meiothermus sp. TaxID=1955249 RepID=UPI00298EF249|nr:VWA domain-containing protein [Meiothermus sp.]MDW8425717.1 VWA domain-containing protein [Meiothermus sp.]
MGFWFLLLGVAAAEARNPPQYVFLVDVSASMIGREDGRTVVFPLVQRELMRFAERVAEETEVYLVPFSGEPQGGARFALPREREAMLRYIRSLQAGGSASHIFRSLRQVYNELCDQPRAFYLFTDGLDNSAEPAQMPELRGQCPLTLVALGALPKGFSEAWTGLQQKSLADQPVGWPSVSRGGAPEEPPATTVLEAPPAGPAPAEPPQAVEPSPVPQAEAQREAPLRPEVRREAPERPEVWRQAPTRPQARQEARPGSEVQGKPVRKPANQERAPRQTASAPPPAQPEPPRADKPQPARSAEAAKPPAATEPQPDALAQRPPATPAQPATVPPKPARYRLQSVGSPSLVDGAVVVVYRLEGSPEATRPLKFSLHSVPPRLQVSYNGFAEAITLRPGEQFELRVSNPGPQEAVLETHFRVVSAPGALVELPPVWQLPVPPLGVSRGWPGWGWALVGLLGVMLLAGLSRTWARLRQTAQAARWVEPSGDARRMGDGPGEGGEVRVLSPPVAPSPISLDYFGAAPEQRRKYLPAWLGEYDLGQAVGDRALERLRVRPVPGGLEILHIPGHLCLYLEAREAIGPGQVVKLGHTLYIAELDGGAMGLLVVEKM